MSKTGVNTVSDLLASRFTARDMGLDTINEVLQNDLAQSNAQASELESVLCDVTTDMRRVMGQSGPIDAVRADEFARVPSAKKNVGVEVDFPLYKLENAIGFTNDFLKHATARELASKYVQARDGQFRAIVTEIKKAIFNDTNFSTTDMYDGTTLNVKRFWNNDGVVPPEWEGTTFLGTHNHYAARVGALAYTDVDTLVSNVTEHGNTRGLMLIISLTDKATIAALTTKFTALTYTHIASTSATDVQISGSEDVNNMMIGYWGGTIPVWVKPYAIANYVLCVATEMPEKPLAFRNDTVDAGIHIAATLDSYPLQAEVLQNVFGVGVWNRGAGAVLYIGDTTWSNPSL